MDIIERLKEHSIELQSIPNGTEDILTFSAVKFVADLHRLYQDPLQKLLQERKTYQTLYYDRGEYPTLKYHSREDWTVAKIPDDMNTRTVEITGPVERKMIINALNSGADCFMADFEDSNSPTWENCIYGQLNLRDAVNRTIEIKTERKDYKLNNKIAKLMVRPRGLHLSEKHLLVDGNPVSAPIFDFGLFMYHNAKILIARNETPAFYLPKLEDHREAMWWDKIISMTEALLQVPHGSVRVTVLLETLPAAFQMTEILYVLRDYISGLNAGRWDYIFSAIKVLGQNPQYIFPDRSEITMEAHMMNSYARLLVQTCKKYGAQAIGGMAAQIPRKDDIIKNEIALAKVRKDKEREASMGYDGTWVAHPGLVDIARQAFKTITVKNVDSNSITTHDLLQVPKGNITYEELVNNIRVSLEYMYNWVNGNGCVAINYLMEDLATYEISRAQIWQWVYHKVELSGGEGKVDDALLSIIIDQIIQENKEYEVVAAKFIELINQKHCVDFSSIIMYEELS